MSQVTSGSVLREARERKGYELNTVARRLRIRPDILRAIENGDYAAMPPRGYTRNMVNAYARLLGLNPTEIVNMYLDEAYAKQVEKARDVAPRARFDMGKESRFSRTRKNTNTYDTGYVAGGYSYLEETGRSSSDGRATSGGRTLYDDRTRFSRDDYGLTRERVPRSGRSDRDFLSHHSGYSSSMPHLSEERSRRPRQRSVSSPMLPVQYNEPLLSRILHSKIILVIAALIVIALIVLLVTTLLGNRNQPSVETVSQLPVSGINDTTQTANGSGEADVPYVVEIAPTSAKVVYTVAKGDECYVEMYDEKDNMTPMILEGPVSETIDVTDEWTITTWADNAIRVTVDGEPVSFTYDDKYNCPYVIKVDFDTILDEWHRTHPNASSSAGRRAAAQAEANQ